MAKRRRSLASGGTKPAGRWPPSDIKHTSVYLPEAAYEALRQVAFDERRKIHDLLVEGVELIQIRRKHRRRMPIRTTEFSRTNLKAQPSHWRQKSLNRV